MGLLLTSRTLKKLQEMYRKRGQLAIDQYVSADCSKCQICCSVLNSHLQQKFWETLAMWYLHISNFRPTLSDFFRLRPKCLEANFKSH